MLMHTPGETARRMASADLRNWDSLIVGNWAVNGTAAAGSDVTCSPEFMPLVS